MKKKAKVKISSKFSGGGEPYNPCIKLHVQKLCIIDERQLEEFRVMIANI